ncbi:uncharacterized protein LOC126681837 [Mercurialis annua]|uniref:uncharacterized protein LOC126681837 n=1 Tax=Mercurialis annua TaxID=3986 RepID=UPI0021607D4D|nr:uncharacterized protein LOC126681837 [Mercurialis annua]
MTEKMRTHLSKYYLKAGSIGSFSDLASAFKARFRTNIPMQKSSSDLRKCKQGEQETLKNFVERFNKEAVHIKNLNHDTAFKAMKMGTRFEELRDKILMKKPTTFQDLMLIAHKYVELDEARRTLMKQHEPTKQDSSRYRGKKEEDRPRTQRYRAGHKPYDFTPLNNAPVYILSWMKQNRVMFNAPRKMDPDVQRDKSRKGEPVEKEEKSKNKKDVVGVVHIIDGGEPYRNTQKKKRNRRGSATIFAIEREIVPEVSFGPDDGQHVKGPHNDALVIEAVIRNHLVKQILVDEGSSVNLLTLEAFKEMKGSTTDLRKSSIPLVGLGGAPVRPEGMVSLYVELGDKKEGPIKRMHAQFNVVDLPLAYNGKVGRPFLYQSGAVTSIRLLTLKMPTSEGEVVVRGNQEMAREKRSRGGRVTGGRAGRRYEGATLTETKAVKIGADVPEEVVQEIIKILKKNAESFATEPSEIVGIDPKVASHKLNVNPGSRHIVQKKRRFTKERQKVIAEEVDVLEATWFIREVHYP